MKRLVIAGGTGFIGRLLSVSLLPPQQVVLTRGDELNVGHIKFVHWDARSTGPWIKELEGCDVLINLAGRSVNCRFTAKNKKEIYDSRLDATRLLARVVQGLNRPPEVWINASTAGIYRHDTTMAHDEVSTEFGADFLARVAVDWEAAFFEPELPHVRRVALRLPLVLGRDFGALPVLKRLVKSGLGGRHGSGLQSMSWIHEKDLARAVAFVCKNKSARGPVNCCAPQVVSNREFMRTLRKALRRPFGLPAPAFAMHIGAMLLGTEPSLVLQNMHVRPAKLMELGFAFEFAGLEPALNDLLVKPGNVNSLPSRESGRIP